MSFVPALKRVAGQFTYAEEDVAFKTRPTNIDSELIVTSLELPIPVKDAEAVYAPGGGRGPIYVTTKRKWNLDGNFSYRVQDGDFLGAIFGICNTEGSSPYTHTITIADLKSFATAYGVDAAADVITEFLGCKVDTGVLKVTDEDYELVCDIDYKACVPSDGASLETYTPNTIIPYVLKEGAFSSTALYTGAKARIYGFELTVKNNLKEIFTQGTFYPYDLVEGYQEYELKVTVGLEDDAEWDEIIDTTDKTYDYSMLLTRGANDTLTISGNAKLKGAPFKIDENDIRAELDLVPITAQVVVVDSIQNYAFE